jgi:hypothetical protein
MRNNWLADNKGSPKKNYWQKPLVCSECIHFRNSCTLGYNIHADSKPCRQGTIRQKPKMEQPNSIDLFHKTGEVERSNSGKTAKNYVFENGKRCFIGQVSCKCLREIADGVSLKVDVCKYRNASVGEHCD